MASGARQGRTIALVAAGFVAIVAIVAGIVVWAGRDGGGGRGAATARSELSDAVSSAADEGVELPGGTDRYVALGDSYSAGEGVEPFESGAGDVEDGGDDCHRSVHAYARQLQVADSVKVDFRACSGARVSDVFDTVQATAGGRSHNTYGKQVESDTLGDDVGLVTLTLGGNDAGFAPVLQFCATQNPLRSCLDQPFKERGQADALPLKDWAQQLRPELGDRLEHVYAQLREGAPNARIVVAGYPHLFLEKGEDVADDCPAALRLAFSRDEQQGLNGLVDDLNATIYEATARAGVEFVDVSEAWRGRGLCSAQGTWMNPVPSGVAGVAELARGAFHPNAEGQAQYAKVIGCYLRSYDVPPAVDQSGTDLPPAPGSAKSPLAACS